MLFIEYPKCSTCRKAKKFLTENNIKFTERNITEAVPSIDELKKWHKISEKPLKAFFNTSGNVYKSENLKEKLPQMSQEEQYILLSSNGMLIKRPILVGADYVIIGFKEDDYRLKLDIK